MNNNSFHTRELVDSSQFPGTQFCLFYWRTEKSGPDTPFVMIVHGMGEHAGRYDELAKFFNSKGLDVFGVDLPGHGLSKKDGKQTRCYSIEECATEVKDALRHILANKKSSVAPWHLYAHSMGGLVSMRIFMDHFHVTQEVPKPKKVFVSAIPLKLRLPVPAWKEAASRILYNLLPHLQLSNEIDPRMLSYNPDNVKAYKEDPLVHPYSSSHQYESIKRTSRDTYDEAKDFHIPIYMAVGNDDPIVTPEGVAEFMELLRCEKKFELIPNAKHEIHNERDRVQVYEKVLNWFLG